MSPLTIAEMALGFSANTCFGLMSSKWGEKQASRLGAGSIAFGIASLAISIFLEAGKKQPPPPLSQADLKHATDALRAQIAEDAFSEEVIDKLSPLQTMAGQVDDAMSRAIADVKSHNRLDPELDDILNKDWAAYYDAFKKIDGYQKQCLDTAQWVADHDARKYDTMDLYQLAASLYLNICQICLMVEWNAVLNDPNAEATWRKAYMKFRKDMKAYKKDHAAWENEKQSLLNAASANVPASGYPSGPSGPPSFYWGGGGGGGGSLIGGGGGNALATLRDEPQPPVPPKTPPQAYTQLKTSVYAKAIKSNVANFISYADPIVTQMEKLLAIHQKVNAVVSKAQLRTAPFDNTYWFDTANIDPRYLTYWFSESSSSQVHNDATGEVWSRAWTPLAQRQAELLKGIEWCGLADDPLIATNHLESDQVASFRKTIDNWKETQNAYDFASTS